ncbi:molybdenum cofactor biosynthesis protein B [Fictibacillus iocasae]|uniref:Molybdenum cofactor biosynthesis protein B n=1 Tax=Fictibacillus iocasae TaxID=2715437 RepID=A0ABW2NU23_9BACL
MSSTPTEHKREAPSFVNASIVTVSDTRTRENDKSGKRIVELLKNAGHTVNDHIILRDEAILLQQQLEEMLADKRVDVILITGGTGIAARDITIETVSSLFDKELPGFGEIFRMLSYTEDIGSSAIMSRAAAGTAGRTALFAIPGSIGAVTLAMEKLILPELQHIKQQLNK